MAVFFRGRAKSEQRTTFNELPAKIQQAILGISGGDYSNIDLSRAENSLQSVAFHAALDLLASLTSELPFDAFRGRGPDKEIVPMSRHAWLEDPDGTGHGVEDWIYMAIMSWGTRGNLYGNILDQGPGGILRQVDLFHPDTVSPNLDEGVVEWSVNGKSVPASQMLHRRVYPMPGILLGLSPVQYHATTLKVNLASSRYGMQWFQDGAHPSGVLKNDLAEIDRTKARDIKDRFMESLRGTRDPVVLGKGWSWETLQITPEESQFLETQGFSAAECARILGPGLAEILGYDTGGSMTYSNYQDRDLSLLKYAANKWLRRMERLLSMFLPRPQYIRFNRKALLQTNTVQRYEAYATALEHDFATVNEVRELEDQPPVPWGDVPLSLAGPTAAPADNQQNQ